MKLYKKIAILMLCAVMVFSFAACNPGEGIPFLSTKSKTTLPDNTVTVTFPEGYTFSAAIRATRRKPSSRSKTQTIFN